MTAFLILVIRYADIKCFCIFRINISCSSYFCIAGMKPFQFFRNSERVFLTADHCFCLCFYNRPICSFQINNKFNRFSYSTCITAGSVLVFCISRQAHSATSIAILAMIRSTFIIGSACFPWFLPENIPCPFSVQKQLSVFRYGYLSAVFAIGPSLDSLQTSLAFFSIRSGFAVRSVCPGVDDNFFSAVCDWLFRGKILQDLNRGQIFPDTVFIAILNNFILYSDIRFNDFLFGLICFCPAAAQQKKRQNKQKYSFIHGISPVY